MQFDPERITLFARTDARGQNIPFGIKAKDRTKHVYVIGKTGMGKSTMLENMAVQDMQNGEGLAFLDPHGATAEKLLEYIPEHRIDDVLYFAPFDMGHPMSFNVMEDVGYDKRHLVVSGLMSTFKKIWVDAWSARMEYILSNTILALLEFPGATLLGVNRMLSDKNYREMIVANVKDPSVKSFWVDEFAKYNERYMQEAGDAIKNKIGQFTANPLIRNIVGQEKSSFDIREMMDDRKILIINLSKGLVGETNANLLGSMFITRTYLAAMSRADLPASEMTKAPNFYLYVDEFQSFANETFANILSEARKYKLNLTIAHQYIEQMEEEVRNAVFGNVGTTISFRVGPFDAEILETVFAPQFTATDLVNLGFAQIYLSLMIDGIGSKPFSAQTLPPIPQQQVSHVDMVIAASRKKYARPRAEVEGLIAKWHEPVVKKVERKEQAKVEPGAGRVGDTSVRKEPVTTTISTRSQEVKNNPTPVRTEASSSRSETLTRPQERKFERREERPVRRESMPERKVPEKNLEDLRSVLQRLSKSEPQKEQANSEHKEDKKQAPRAETPTSQKPVEDLKAALATVARPHALENEPEKNRAPAALYAEIPRVPQEVRPEPVLRQPAEDVPASNEMTRAQLEKMLKVGKHERPPV